MMREIQVEGSQFRKGPRTLGAELAGTCVVRSEDASCFCFDFALQPKLDRCAAQI